MIVKTLSFSHKSKMDKVKRFFNIIPIFACPAGSNLAPFISITIHTLKINYSTLRNNNI